MKSLRLLTCLALGVVPFAAGCNCGGDPSAGTGDGGGGGAGDGGSGGRLDGGDGSSKDGGGGTAGDGALPAGACKRLDLVFAVDDSSSMAQEQQAMRDTVFPAFAQKLQARLTELEDFRAAVIDACPRPGTFHTRGEGGECHFQGGKRWMVSTSTNLTAEFQCVGSIDSSDSTCSGNNDDEQPASAAAASLEPPAYGPGAPNDGFSRADSLLVVVAITDEDEQPVPSATAQQVYDRLLKVKGSDVRRVVFLGIGGASACSGAYGSAKEATKLKALTGLFVAKGRGVFWDLCKGRLEDGLDETLDLIKKACDELPTPSCPAGQSACPGGSSDCTSGFYCAAGCCVPNIN